MENAAINFSKEAILLIIYLSAPAVVVSLVVGLAISLFQATTQIQDQSLTFVPKLVAVLIALIITAEWGGRIAIQFASKLFGEFHIYFQ